MKNNPLMNEKPYPQRLPKPTWFPFMVAIGVTFILWSILTSWLLALIGLIIFIFGLVGWIQDMREESILNLEEKAKNTNNNGRE